MTYRKWLRQCAELRRECEQRGEQEDLEQRIKEEAEGKTRHRIFPDPPPKTRRFAEPKAQELMEYLAANAARWQVELQQLAGDVDSEFLSENFVEFMQRPLLRFLAENYPLRPGGIFHALNLEFSEWRPTDESAQEFFFSQIPFGAWPLDDADMQTVWIDFLETWAGEDASPDPLHEFVLNGLADWYQICHQSLHWAAVREHWWRSYRDELLLMYPDEVERHFMGLHYVYQRAARQSDSKRCFELLEELSDAGSIEIEVFEAIEHVLSEAVPVDLMNRADEKLRTGLADVWDALDYSTRLLLERAEVTLERNWEAEFGNAPLQYFKAIENEWNEEYRRWCRATGYGKPRIEDKRDIYKAITAIVDNRQVQEFIDACPRPAFLQNRRTRKILRPLKDLRRKEAHPYEVEAERVVKVVQSLWEDDFLKKYFQALVPRP